MKNFTMGLGEQRKQNGMVPRKPLRTIKEMAAEFGVSRSTLSAYIGHHNGPAAMYIAGSSHHRTKNTWYDPDVLRAWWKELQPKLEKSRAMAKEKRRKGELGPIITRAFLAQQWLRKHGPATQRQIIEAGFINMTASTIMKMIGAGSLIKEKRDGRFVYIATDKDYIRNGRRHETP